MFNFDFDNHETNNIIQNFNTIAPPQVEYKKSASPLKKNRIITLILLIIQFLAIVLVCLQDIADVFYLPDDEPFLEEYLVIRRIPVIVDILYFVLAFVIGIYIRLSFDDWKNRRSWGIVLIGVVLVIIGTTIPISILFFGGNLTPTQRRAIGMIFSTNLSIFGLIVALMGIFTRQRRGKF